MSADPAKHSPPTIRRWLYGAEFEQFVAESNDAILGEMTRRAGVTQTTESPKKPGRFRSLRRRPFSNGSWRCGEGVSLEQAVLAEELCRCRIGANPIAQGVAKCRGIALQGAFPYDCNPPLCLQKRRDGPMIACPVARQLLAPEFRPGRGQLEQATIVMPMPETPMYEDDRPPFGKNDIRPAPDIFGM